MQFIDTDVHTGTSAPSPLSLDGFVRTIAHTIDCTDEASFLGAASHLSALARDRTVLAERIARELDAPGLFQPGNPYTASSLVLVEHGDFILRANLWPTDVHDPVYGLPHNHSFSFLTIGYAGPGYRSECYQLDTTTLRGEHGESVPLTPVCGYRLQPGTIVYYRAQREVHTQRPPDEPSISLNLISRHLHAGSGRDIRDQLYFDIERERVALVQDDYAGARTLCELARRVGTSACLESLATVAQDHRSPDVRAAANRHFEEAEQSIQPLAIPDARAIGDA